MVNILWIDTETPGLDPEKNRLLQIAARLDVAPDKEGSTPAPIYFEVPLIQGMYNDCLTPTFEVSLGALKVNRKTMTFLSAPNDEISSVGRFVNWLLEMQRKYGDY